MLNYFSTTLPQSEIPTYGILGRGVRDFPVWSGAKPRPKSNLTPFKCYSTHLVAPCFFPVSVYGEDRRY